VMPFCRGYSLLKTYGAIREDDAGELGAAISPVIGFFEFGPFGLSATISQRSKGFAEQEGIRGQGSDAIR